MQQKDSQVIGISKVVGQIQLYSSWFVNRIKSGYGCEWPGSYRTQGEHGLSGLRVSTCEWQDVSFEAKWILSAYEVVSDETRPSGSIE